MHGAAQKKTALFITGCLLISPWAHSNNADPGAGSLLLRLGKQSVIWVAPVLDSDVNITVNGPVVRALVKQRFHNPSSEWAEATYLFPLPEDAAVDQMRMRIGERVIEGKIKEREQARKIYQTAKKAGKRTSLVEQQRPNMFTTRVANIPPGEYIVVEIEYQHSVKRDGTLYSLRYPMTITPRYTPGQMIADRARHNAEAAAGTEPPMPDQAVTPPWSTDAIGTKLSRSAVNPTRITVNINAGFELASVTSTSHTLRTNPQHSISTPSQRTVSLVPDTVNHSVSDRDFLLHWQPAGSTAPQAAFFIQQHQSGNAQMDMYGLLQITPPTLEPDANRLPRDVIFVIDTSGSMGGEPIRQARQSLQWALQRLQPEDRFNIVQFNSVTRVLFDDVQPALPGVLNLARKYVASLNASGGTEMLAASNAALCKDCNDPERVRQVIFITDGAIGNEDQLFRSISANIGSTRLFTVGIGSAPNSYFMRKAAEFGRGTFTYIATAKDVSEKMAALYRKIEAPVLTDLKLKLPHGSTADILPNPLPDLYAGEPLVAVMKMPPSSAHIEVSGRAGNVQWQQNIELLEGQQQLGIHQLWARQKLEQLNDLRRNQHDPVVREQLRNDVVKLALNHHLVSPFTSLVAVDVTPVKPAAEPIQKHQISNNKPKGTQLSLPQTATSARLQLLIALLLLAVACAVWGRSAWRSYHPVVVSAGQ